MLKYSKLFRKAEKISGVPISNEIKKRIKMEVDLLERPPCLVVVHVGNRADSVRYVNNKRIAAEACGIEFHLVSLPEHISQQKLHKELISINSNPVVDGVLLQLPLPPHLRTRKALFHINPFKDVDGLHPSNFGNLFIHDQQVLSKAISDADTEVGKNFGEDMLVADNAEGDAFRRVGWRSYERRFFIPCTALAVRTLLFSYLNRKYHFFSHNAFPNTNEQKTLHAVVVNKSMVVGVPTTALLMKEGHFMVTMCSRSDSLETLRKVMKTADVLITAYGVANVFDETFVKEGAVVIDVAINSQEEKIDGTQTQKRTVYGDIDFASVSKVASAITTVPGGVGPLTVAHLMQNVVKAYHLRRRGNSTNNKLYQSLLSINELQDKADISPFVYNADESKLKEMDESVDPEDDDEDDSDNNSFIV